ncbi:DUF2529 family protein [Natribacillus halophilus]|uniref:DUF2529 domain-containing protein n=1 Tax=Natribacillus halophilus TaxID=549003 RepID=A0A1G8KVP2_9BACI|nr:DUF2529 family protein [Natribacillus halophilus]SDI47449.1 protein of unknown function [Natribacillus halophilus]
MLKSYTTQLQHVFTTIRNEEETIADGARLLAQALVGNGNIYVCAGKPFASLAETIVHNQDTPGRIHFIPWYKKEQATAADRLLVLTDGSETEEDTSQLQQLLEAYIPLVFLGPAHPRLTFVEGMEDPIVITTPSSPIVPDYDGDRRGYPTEIAIIYAYQAIIFEILDMID